MKIIVLTPVYNDWQSVYKLIDEINNISLDQEFKISVYIFNDNSNHDRPDFEKNLENIASIKIFNMKKNQGHARCIATGLKYIFEKDNFDYVIPMDGDGEDRPEEIEFFLSHIKKSKEITHICTITKENIELNIENHIPVINDTLILLIEDKNSHILEKFINDY